MHELSLCAAIADIATRTAGGRPVAAVHIRIGQLRQVVPDTLEFCWSMLIAETELAQAALVIERVDAVLACRSCGGESPFDEELMFVCSHCGGTDVRVQSGDEFDVTALDLAVA